jgi:hypothetical protein
MEKAKQIVIWGALVFVLMSPNAWAFEEPSSGTFGYELFEFARIVFTGASGVVIALGILGYCVYHILRSNVFGAITCACAALVLVKIEDIVYS